MTTQHAFLPTGGCGVAAPDEMVEPSTLAGRWLVRGYQGQQALPLDQDFPAKSNRLESQDAGVIGSQCFPVFAMLLSMISNFRIQAVRASFLGFPAARSRW